jgi:hypothetical protein
MGVAFDLEDQVALKRNQLRKRQGSRKVGNEPLGSLVNLEQRRGRQGGQSLAESFNSRRIVIQYHYLFFC